MKESIVKICPSSSFVCAVSVHVQHLRKPLSDLGVCFGLSTWPLPNITYTLVASMFTVLPPIQILQYLSLGTGGIERFSFETIPLMLYGKIRASPIDAL